MSATEGGRQWKIGDLARATGLTIRTLHHYDELGLITPSTRTEAGHRLYGEADIARLQQVLSLRSLGFALEEIGDCLRQREFSPQRLVQLHLDRLTEQMALQQQLRERLEGLARLLNSGRIVSAEEFLRSIAAMSKVESYYTPEQMEYLRQRREAVGEARIQEVEAEWPRLIQQVKEAVAHGMDPASAPARELARRWNGLVEEFTGGDPGIRESLRQMYEGEPEIATAQGMENMPELVRFIAAASDAR